MISILLTVFVMAITVIIGAGRGVMAAPLLTPTVAPITDPTEICRAAVEGMDALTDDLTIPENLSQEQPIRMDTDFDVMAYFTVLDHLAMREGYVLDYYYNYAPYFAGLPILYARSLNGSLPEVRKIGAYLDYIVPDGSPSGYLQAAILSVMGGQFYLYWHANDGYTIICDADMLDEVSQSLPDEVRAVARDLVPRPEVRADSVSLLVYTQHGGFLRMTVTFDPFQVETEVLVPYDSGVVF
jgi:hypothetical protein